MSRPARIDQLVFASLTLTCMAAWGACGTAAGETTTGTSSTGETSSSGTGGGAGAGGDPTIDGGTNQLDDAGVCTSTSAEAHRVALDIVFVIDRTGSLFGPQWYGVKAGLTTFFYDPASSGVSAGIVYFPTAASTAWSPDCDVSHYLTLDVPIDVLPGHAFALVNSLPADATYAGTPTWGVLKAALQVATARQDANPTHRVVVVLATDHEWNGCNNATVDDIADLAKSARSYNGVQTYVIGVEGSIIPILDKIAVAGGTTATYDVTEDIGLFSKKMTEIRGQAIGCGFELPPPPDNLLLDPERVNFSYTPKGLGPPKLLPRADDLADCKDQPGWYYDSNNAPSKIILCPASCATVQADGAAKVDVLFGCQSVPN